MLKLISRAVRIGGGVLPTLKLCASVLQREGWSGVVWRLNAARRMSYIDQYSGSVADAVKTDYNRGYDTWRKRNESVDVSGELTQLGAPLLISILMPVYRPRPEFLERAIESVRRQTYGHWELCICDDASNDRVITALLQKHAVADKRIKFMSRHENGHISAATNDALALASGEYVGFLDNDDELHKDALAHIRIALHRSPQSELLYSDEDKIDEKGRRHHPYFKPEFNPVLMLAQNMLTHLCVYKTSAVRDLGGLRLGVEGAQDWDLAFRFVEARGTDRICHIPRVLYHWRETEGSTARGSNEKSYATDAQIKVVQQHLGRLGRSAKVMPAPLAPGMLRVRYDLPENQPLVSIVIPTRDKVELLKICISSLYAKTEYKNFEVIVVDNGSVEAITKGYFEEIENGFGVRLLNADIPFNYSKLNNMAAEIARGDFILMLNNDIEITDGDWLSEMMSWAQWTETGCVGAKLWYPNGTLQHGGVILGINGIAGHAHRGISKIDPGYYGRAAVHQNFSAVTGACMLVRKSVFEMMGGLNERFAVAYNDIDFCLRVNSSGMFNVWTPYASMIHHESATRGIDISESGRDRLNGEVQLMKHQWADVIANDFAYSKNLTHLDENLSIEVLR